MSHIAESYLDNAATTPTRSEVIERMNEVMRDAWGSPSSVHAVGMRAKEVLEESRATIAGALGVEPGEVYFTSGATESNNLAVRGVCSARRDNPAKIITSTLEHASVTRTVKRTGQLPTSMRSMASSTWGNCAMRSRKAPRRSSLS